MIQKNGATTFSVQSPSDNAVKDSDKGFEDESRLVSPPYSDSDSRRYRSVPQHSAQEVLPPPSRQEGTDPDNNEIPIPSDCTRPENSDSERWKGKVLKKGMHFKESGGYSNFNEGHPDRIHHLMESRKKSMSPSFSTLEAYGNLNNQLEASYEKDLMELQQNDGSVHDQDSPGRIAKVEVREVYVSPAYVEDKKLLIPMIDKCESCRVHCEGISSLHGLKQDISISMKQKLSSPGPQIQHELESNFFSGSKESDSSIELCLPAEDSLITFDEQSLMPDETKRSFC
ncbi:hypothetical protein L6164_008391 [Bauhinia variegata]|uniref:Uncharacterized protein n=1 Tax=Bauhinia variegata TaxID=167791 RepID=A0ACB9PFQ7_BAUVA|nr:hypothetical protein L6164_008391 [Bauhinia variegata]